MLCFRLLLPAFSRDENMSADQTIEMPANHRNPDERHEFRNPELPGLPRLARGRPRPIVTNRVPELALDAKPEKSPQDEDKMNKILMRGLEKSDARLRRRLTPDVLDRLPNPAEIMQVAIGPLKRKIVT